MPYLRWTASPAKNVSLGRARIPRPDYLFSFFGAATAGNDRYYLDLFAATGVHDKVSDVDDALVTSVGAIEAGVMRLYGVVVILSRWVRVGCARLCGVHSF
jgi:hypothetical protein